MDCSACVLPFLKRTTAAVGRNPPDGVREGGLSGTMLHPLYRSNMGLKVENYKPLQLMGAEHSKQFIVCSAAFKHKDSLSSDVGYKKKNTLHMRFNVSNYVH